MDDDEITITKAKLAAALEKWDVEAKANGWAERDDAEKFNDNADYLFGLLKDAD